MVDDKKSGSGKPMTDKVADWTKVWLIRVGKVVLAIIILTKIIPAIVTETGLGEARPLKYAAAYDFSKITERAISKTFIIPAGNKWVLVELPAHYRVTLSSATAKGAELDKLDGSKPILFSQKEFGELPLAIAIKNPKECEMTISFVRL